MTKEERELYHSDVKAKSDWNAGIRFAEKKAAEEVAESIAKSLKQKAMSVQDIAEVTGFRIESS